MIIRFCLPVLSTEQGTDGTALLTALNGRVSQADPLAFYISH